MIDDWNEMDKILVSGTHCPMPTCGALAVAYQFSQDRLGLWEFTCPDCGIDFVASESDLVFRAVPPGWLRGGIHAA